MTPKAQRIAIATACGWGRPYQEGVGYLPMTNAPDYLDDLNAIHKAEKVLTKTELYAYGNILDDITRPKGIMEMVYVHNPEAGMYPELYRATAAQRAEAFLRTLKLWEETP